MCSLVATVVACAGPSAPQAGTGGTPVVMDLAEAHPGAAAAIVSFSARMRPGLRLHAATVTPDGLVAGSLLDARRLTRSLVLVDPRTGRATATLRENPSDDPADGVRFRPVVADDRYVAWAETSFSDEDWKIMLHDRRSGRTRVVADGSKWRSRCGIGLSPIFLAEGRLWFSACSPGPQGTPSVYSADLAAPKPRLWRTATSLTGFGPAGRRFATLHTGDTWMPRGTVILDAEGQIVEHVPESGPRGLSAELSVWRNGEGMSGLRLRHGGRDWDLPHQPSSVEAAGPFAAWTTVPTAETPIPSIWLYDSRTATALRLSDTDNNAAFSLTQAHVLWTDSATHGEDGPRPETLHLLPLPALTS
ncbi:hypothetical protein EDD29_1255 [Actinocorallia herbida]|uniref:WD40 repeat protein n=2 Tax=Actinocorallia herbida TaxID=58109 RepID=A0A3N1CR04_9ACTN|nr:hypothetical protein EDD29_1255 [Actinocorallia herbida]